MQRGRGYYKRADEHKRVQNKYRVIWKIDKKIASIGFTKPNVNQSNALNMNLSGFACLIRRVNVVPKNNYIEVKSETKSK